MNKLFHKTLLFFSLLWVRYDPRTYERISARKAWKITRDCTMWD